MLCPTDQTTLVMAERKGVEIDYCPTCRGVWLDRGELDKIIDRSLEAEIAAEAGSPAAAVPQPAAPAQPAAPQYGTPTSYPPAPAPGYDPRYERRDDRYDRRDDRYDRRDDRGYRRDDDYRKRKKKESWLGDLFDF